MAGADAGVRTGRGTPSTVGGGRAGGRAVVDQCGANWDVPTNTACGSSRNAWTQTALPRIRCLRLSSAGAWPLRVDGWPVRPPHRPAIEPHRRAHASHRLLSFLRSLQSQYRIMRLSPTRSPPYATPARDPHYQLCRHAGPRREGAARSWSRRDGPARTRPRLPAGAAGGTLRWNIIPTSPAPRQVLHEPPSERCLQQWDPVAITVVSSWIRPRGEQQLPPARSELSRRGAPLPRGQSAAASPIQPIQGDDARCWQCGAGSLWAHVEGPHSRQVRGGLRRLCSSLLDPRLHAGSSVQTRPDCAVVVVGVFAARSVPHLLLPLSLAHTSACASEPPPLPSPSLVPAAVCAIAADLTRSSPCSCLW